jgi:Uncharacterized conserved protein (COG2071)
MRLPAIQGIIDRRILVNFRADPGVVSRLLPPPFRPKLAHGFAMAGICLIRLKDVRPIGMRIVPGIRSENAAHRFAVEWEQNGRQSEGVFIPRRDSNSRINALLGGRLVPGIHHLANFEVLETDDRLSVGFESHDSETWVRVTASVATRLPEESIFTSVHEASQFFEHGALGYSATKEPNRYDGLELRCKSWSVRPLTVETVQSSYFDDLTKFPSGSITFDCALLMRGVEHEWHTRGELCCEQPAGI